MQREPEHKQSTQVFLVIFALCSLQCCSKELFNKHSDGTSVNFMFSVFCFLHEWKIDVRHTDALFLFLDETFDSHRSSHMIAVICSTYICKMTSIPIMMALMSGMAAFAIVLLSNKYHPSIGASNGGFSASLYTYNSQQNDLQHRILLGQLIQHHGSSGHSVLHNQTSSNCYRKKNAGYTNNVWANTGNYEKRNTENANNGHITSIYRKRNAGNNAALQQRSQPIDTSYNIDNEPCTEDESNQDWCKFLLE